SEACSELGQDVRDVALCGPPGQEQLGGDVGVGPCHRHEVGGGRMVKPQRLVGHVAEDRLPDVVHPQPHVRLLRAALPGHLDRIGVHVQPDHPRLGYRRAIWWVNSASPHPASSTDQAATAGSTSRPPSRNAASNHRSKSSRSSSNWYSSRRRSSTPRSNPPRSKSEPPSTPASLHDRRP